MFKLNIIEILPQSFKLVFSQLPLFGKTGEGLPEDGANRRLRSRHGGVLEDYVATRLTLRDHPVNLLRDKLPRFSPAEYHRTTSDGAWLAVTGLVITRQRPGTARSEEHTSELQSHSDIVCRLLLEKKKQKKHAVLIEKKLLTVTDT